MQCVCMCLCVCVQGAGCQEGWPWALASGKGVLPRLWILSQDNGSWWHKEEGRQNKSYLGVDAGQGVSEWVSEWTPGTIVLKQQCALWLCIHAWLHVHVYTYTHWVWSPSPLHCVPLQTPPYSSIPHIIFQTTCTCTYKERLCSTLLMKATIKSLKQLSRICNFFF